VAIGLLVALIAHPAWTATADADQPIHIRADSAELDETRGMVIYRGAVRLDQGTLKVTADTMTIELEDERVIRVTAEGRRALYQQRLTEDRPEVLADADKIVYHTQDERIDSGQRACPGTQRFSGKSSTTTSGQAGSTPPQPNRAGCADLQPAPES
jgi:lipopolysaccharide transport protein LptA